MTRLILFTLLMIYFVPGVFAQQDTMHGTITIKKKDNRKTLFDQANYKLILVDRNGKVVKSGDVSFDMVMEKDGKMITLASKSRNLTHEMQDYLRAAQEGTVFYFKNIQLKKDAGMEHYPSTVVKVDAEFYRQSKTLIEQ